MKKSQKERLRDEISYWKFKRNSKNDIVKQVFALDAILIAVFLFITEYDVVKPWLYIAIGTLVVVINALIAFPSFIPITNTNKEEKEIEKRYQKLTK